MVIQLQAPIFQPTLSDLPPVPADPRGEGRHVSWVEAVRAPGFYYGAEFVAVDGDWIDQRVSNFSSLLESKPGWLAPVLIAHHDSGERQGDMFEVRRWSLAGVPVMLAAVAWVDPAAQAKIRNHQLTHVSIGLHHIQRSDTGEVLEDTPAEVSTTTIPHLGTARVLNTATGGKSMSDESTPTVEATAEDAATLRARIEELIAQNATLQAELAAIKAAGDAPPVVDEEEEEDEPAEMTALRTRVAELEAKAVAAELSAHKANLRSAYRGGSLTLTADLLDAIGDATHGNESLLNVIDAAYVEASEPASQPKAIRATIPEALRKRLSAAGASTPVVQQLPTTKEECDMLAEAEAGGDAKKKGELYHKHLKAMEARR